MRSPHVRLTVRRTIALAMVPLFVLGIGAELIRRRTRVLQTRVAQHAAERLRLKADGDGCLHRAAADPTMRPVHLFDAERHVRAVAWHAEREEEDRRALWRPWTPVPPDRPGPPWPPIPPELYPVIRPESPAVLDRPRM